MNGTPNEDRRAVGETPEGHRPGDDRDLWRQWMVDLGRQLRGLRELVDLSQQELARLAGVSQGAVSHLETARGLATPLLIVLKINLALTAELSKLDGNSLNTGPRSTLGLPELLRWGESGFGSHPTESTPDPMFETFVRLYRETTARQREGLLAIMRSATAALRDKSLLNE